MKKWFYASLTVNALLIGVFIGKRIYYSCSNPTPPVYIYDQVNAARTSIFNNLPIDTTDIVFVGTSLTEGFPVMELFGPHVKNRGIGGNRIRHVMGRIYDIAKQHPRLIILEIGINELIANEPMRNFLTNYKAVIDTIRQAAPKSEICIQSILPICGEQMRLNGAIRDYNAVLAKFCLDNQLTFINCYPSFILNGELDSTTTYDGIHFKWEGYRRWRNCLNAYGIYQKR